MTTTVTTPKAPFLRVRTRLTPRRLAISVGASSAVIAVSSAIAWNGRVSEWEAEPLRWIVRWPDWLEPALLALQQVGVLLTPVIVGAFVGWRTKRWRHFLAFSLVLPLKLFIEKAVIKQLVDRERPFSSLGADIEVRGPQLAGLSFPSGHVTTAVATAILLTAFLPRKWRPVPIAWAGVVAVARMYLGEHNLLDVVAGAAVGTLFATVIWWTMLNGDAPEARGS